MSKFLLQSGGGFFTLQGGSGVLELQSTVAGGATGTAALAAVTMTAPAVTASVITSGTGTISAPDITLSAPATTAASASDGNSSTSIAPVTLTSPSTTAAGTISATGATDIAAVTLSAPAATGSTPASATATVAAPIVDILTPNLSATGTNINYGLGTQLGLTNLEQASFGLAVGNYAYLTGGSTAINVLTAVDITDRTALSLASTTSTTFTWPSPIAYNGTNVFIVNLISQRLQKWDISTPSTPTIVSSANTGATIRRIAADATYVYCCDDSFVQLDVRLASDMSLVGSLNLTGTGNFTSGIAVNGNYVYITKTPGTDSQLLVIDVSTPATPSLVGTIALPGLSNDLYYADDKLYTSSSTHDVIIIDVSVPTAPDILSSYVSPTTVVKKSGYVVDNYFVAIDANSRVYWYDISNPLSPFFIGFVSASSVFATSMFRDVDGGYFMLLTTGATSRGITPFRFAVASLDGTATLEAPFVDIASPLVSVSASSVVVRVSAPDVTLKAPTIVIGSADNGIHKTVISQYANSPQILELVQNYADVFNAQRLLVDFVYNIWDVRTANSLGLDIWGRIVGVSRYLTLTNQDYFGFDPDFDPFNESPFFSGTAVTNTYILSDDDFRRVILAKALNNISKTTIPAIDRILNLLYGHRGIVFAQVTGDFELTYVFNFEPTAIDQAIAEAPDLLPKPAGFTIINDFVF